MCNNAFGQVNVEMLEKDNHTINLSTMFPSDSEVLFQIAIFIQKTGDDAIKNEQIRETKILNDSLSSLFEQLEVKAYIFENTHQSKRIIYEDCSDSLKLNSNYIALYISDPFIKYTIQRDLAREGFTLQVFCPANNTSWYLVRKNEGSCSLVQSPSELYYILRNAAELSRSSGISSSNNIMINNLQDRIESLEKRIDDLNKRPVVNELSDPNLVKQSKSINGNLKIAFSSSTQKFVVSDFKDYFSLFSGSFSVSGSEISIAYSQRLGEPKEGLSFGYELGLSAGKNVINIDAFNFFQTTRSFDSEGNQYHKHIYGKGIKEQVRINYLSIPLGVFLKKDLGSKWGLNALAGLTLNIINSSDYNISEGSINIRAKYPGIPEELQNIESQGLVENLKPSNAIRSLDLQTYNLGAILELALSYEIKESLSVFGGLNYLVTANLLRTSDHHTEPISSNPNGYNSLMYYSNELRLNSFLFTVGLNLTL